VVFEKPIILLYDGGGENEAKRNVLYIAPMNLPPVPVSILRLLDFVMK
jgi:hypothetical protein